MPSVTVGVLSSSTMLIVTELGDPLLAEAPDKELIEITADLLPPEALSLVGLNTAVPVVVPALIVIFDSDAYGSNGSENVALTSPIFDCSSLTVIKLSYVHFAAILDPSGYGSNAYVEVYNGTEWVLVAEYSPTTVAPFTNDYTYDYGEKLITEKIIK